MQYLHPKEVKHLVGNIWKFYLYQFVGSLFITVSIFILYYRLFGLSYSQISLIELVTVLTIIVLEIPSGALADLLGRKNCLIATQIVYGAAFLITGLTSNFYVFLFAAFVMGIGHAFFSGTAVALFYDTLKKLKREQDYLKIRGYHQALFFIGITISSVIGAHLFAINPRFPYIANAILLFISSIIVASMVEPYNHRKHYTIKQHYLKIKDSFKFVLKKPYLVWIFLFALIGFYMLFFFQYVVSQPYVLSLGFNVQNIGWLFALFYLLSGFVAFNISRIESLLKEKLSLLSLIIFQVIALGAMSYFKNYWVVIVVPLIFMTWTFGGIVIENYIQRRVPSSERATILSIQSMILNGFLSIIYYLLGLLTDYTSIRYVFGLNAIIVLVIGVLMIIYRIRYINHID